MRSMRGQSAMEYLMTYGWALLVIVIVVAVLMWINPFKPPEQCIPDQAGFTCMGQRIVTTSTFGTNVLFATVTNGNQKAVDVVGVACILGRSQQPANWWTWNNYSQSRTLEYQGDIQLGNITQNNGQGKGVVCFRDWGTQTSGGVPMAANPNQDFAGRVYIAYRMSDESQTIPPKVVGMNLVTRTQ